MLALPDIDANPLRWPGWGSLCVSRLPFVAIINCDEVYREDLNVLQAASAKGGAAEYQSSHCSPVSYLANLVANW